MLPVLYTALVPQKILVVCQAVGDWRPFSVWEPKVSDKTKPTIGTEIQGHIFGGGTKTTEVSKSTVMEDFGDDSTIAL